MKALSLSKLALEQLEVARNATSGRAARTLHGGHDAVLRQAVLAFTAGHGLADHVAPGQATLQVLVGRVHLVTPTDLCAAEVGDYLVIPEGRHSVEAVEDSAVLLTVALTEQPASSHRFEQATLRS